jgi:ADP-ribose pyrophosphatase YjhB (NUDIX family)
LEKAAREDVLPTDQRAVKFCFDCGEALTIASGSPARLHCRACGYIHYENPKILVSCLAAWEDKVLWMRRANEPYRGLWSVPCGFMEQGETLAAAAARELCEETNVLCEETNVQLSPESLSLYVVGSLTWMNQVYVVFRAQLLNTHCVPGDEALEVGLFSESEAPWDRFAFPQSEAPTRQFYHELNSGSFGLYMGEYTPEYTKTWLIGSGAV